MMDNRKYYSTLINNNNEDSKNPASIDIDDYLSFMSQDNAEGGDTEIQACCNYYKVNIVIYSDKIISKNYEPVNDSSLFTTINENENNGTVKLFYKDNNYYLVKQDRLKFTKPTYDYNYLLMKQEIYSKENSSHKSKPNPNSGHNPNGSSSNSCLNDRIEEEKSRCSIYYNNYYILFYRSWFVVWTF